MFSYHLWILLSIPHYNPPRNEIGFSGDSGMLDESQSLIEITTKKAQGSEYKSRRPLGYF